MAERELNFTYILTAAENAAVNNKYRHVKKAISRNLITDSEGQFIYAEYLIQTIKDKAFTIYTNSPAF